MKSSKLQRVQVIFREVLDDERLTITGDFSQNDSSDWDSVATVQIVLATEREFGVRLPTELVAQLKDVGQLLSALPD